MEWFFVRWSHRQFDDVVKKRYFSEENLGVKSWNVTISKLTFVFYVHLVAHYYKNLSEYFLGTWSGGKAKPYNFTQQQRAKLRIDGRVGEADR